MAPLKAWLLLHGEALARHREHPTPFRFTHWDEAVTELMRITDRGGPTIAVIDEFPFLAKASPTLPSIIQRALDPAAQHTSTPVRLPLCGSAVSFMSGLLAGNAPLRGRAGLELVVPTLDFRLAAEFWEITDLRTALLTHAIVGGTPTYRRECTQGDTPPGPTTSTPGSPAVLNPARPLFREARYLLAEEPRTPRHRALPLRPGRHRRRNAARGGIADYLGRKSTDLAHPLSVLQDVGVITTRPTPSAAIAPPTASLNLSSPSTTRSCAPPGVIWNAPDAPPPSGAAPSPPSAARLSARTSNRSAANGPAGDPAGLFRARCGFAGGT